MQRRTTKILVLLAFGAAAFGALQLLHHHDAHYGQAETCQVCFWHSSVLTTAILLAIAILLQDHAVLRRILVTQEVPVLHRRPRAASSRAPPIV